MDKWTIKWKFKSETLRPKRHTDADNVAYRLFNDILCLFFKK